VDVLIVDSDGHPLLLHNETAPTGHWIELRLIGTRSNRDAYGAVVWLQARGGKLMRYCHSDGSYLSASDRRVHFGVARATQVTVTVKWPSGATDIFPALATDRIVTLHEGSGSHPPPGGCSRRRDTDRKTARDLSPKETSLPASLGSPLKGRLGQQTSRPHSESPL
jgi:hypothetical protein